MRGGGLNVYGLDASDVSPRATVDELIPAGMAYFRVKLYRCSS